MNKLLSLAVAMLVAGFFGGLAVAQSTCAPHASMIMKLDMRYGEARLGIGRGGSNLFEMWANIETGSWTILEVFPSGMACVRAAGEGWTVDPPVLPGKPT